MLIRTGRGLSPLAKPARLMIFDLISSLPADFTYTRNDTVATYRDTNGNLQKGTANAPRFDHDVDGTAFGMCFEGSIQNKLTSYNANPTDNTGWTKGGDAASTLAAVSDPSSYLSGTKLSSVCTGGKIYKLDNSGGSTDAYAESSATFGTTTVHTISSYIVATGGGTAAQLTRSGSSPTALDIGSGSSLQRYTFPLTPNATTDKMRILAKPGKIVYFILSQMEALDFASSVIVTAGAAATRAAERTTVSSITSKSWYNAEQGAIIAQCRFKGLRASNAQYPFCLCDNTSSNTRAVRLYTDNYFRGLVNAGAAARHTDTLYDRPEFNKRYPVAMIWKTGETNIVTGGAKYTDKTYSGEPTGIDRLEIGTRNGGSDPMFGHIENIKIYKAFRPMQKIGPDIMRSTDRAIITGGQSNALGYHRSAADSSDGGKLQMVSVMDSIWTTSTHNYVADGATSTTAALNASTVNDWWYDDDTGEFGVPYQKWEQTALCLGGQVRAIIWSQGEEDDDAINTGTVTAARYKAALLAIFAKMRSVVGNVPVIIDPIGRRGSGSAGTGFQQIREVQQALDSENSWIYLSPEKLDQPLTDSVHLTNAGYVTQANRIIRKILSALGETITGGVNGPVITGAVRVGTAVTVTIAHDSGTDFAPTSGIQGFVFLDNTTPITINASVRTNATTITLTLNSTPSSGTETLYYCQDIMLSLDPTKLVVDNATVSLPLRSKKITL